jgi:lysine decarboxylase/arginine decarboxylase
MHEQIRRSNQMKNQALAVAELPRAEMTPCAAYQRLVHDDVELLPLSQMSERVVATGVVPYPPGIPLLMPGESAGATGGAVLLYLQALEDWDRLFPGFEHETHGVDHVGGRYHVSCVRSSV